MHYETSKPGSTNAWLFFYAEGKQADEWVYSYGWDESLWGGEQPKKQWLDEACPDKPVALERMCGHKIVVNSRAGSTLDTQRKSRTFLFACNLAEHATTFLLPDARKRKAADCSSHDAEA